MVKMMRNKGKEIIVVQDDEDEMVDTLGFNGVNTKHVNANTTKSIETI